ncbi:fungal-specific transcription factor domain-containing protein [Xylogone sp. PMI_703]|nr:fungal-specific transcription factor domain-containing protein [Xylogone sp. PMI_703]
MSTAPPPKRQRTARACDDCKKRKKQCNGLQPCQGCLARSQECKFSDPKALAPPPSYGLEPDVLPSKRTSQTKTPDPVSENAENGAKASDGTESVIENSSRMLYDERGRLLYVGESASLSYLQAIRRLVEEHIGPSAFTNDGNRHMILEATMSTPPKFQFTYALPDKETALFLIDSFFSGLPGLVRIYNKENFLQRTNHVYENPLECDTLLLCSLHLVFAIGLQLKRDNPSPSSTETRILEKLISKYGSRSELFYLSAKHLHDAVDGFEEGGLTSVQILILKTLYMLTAAKRNSAWAFLGMAVRLAYALGIHKETTFSFLPPEEQEARRDIWRSLYVLDCFLAVSFGRPTAINHKNAAYTEPNPSIVYRDENAKFEADALLASVKVSSILGEILNRIYDKRKISKSTVRSISAEFYQWKKDLSQKLQWQNISTQCQDSDIALTQLHVNLIYFHGIILLMRPFLLSEVTHYLESKANTASGESQQGSTFKEDQDVKSFSRACIHSAVYTINAVQATFLRGALPRQDPFIVYWLFTATIIVVSGVLYPVDKGLDLETAIRAALSVLQFMSEADKQARRYLYITKSARDAICQSRAVKEATSNDSGLSIFQALFREDIGLAGGNTLNNIPSQMPGSVSGPSQAWNAESALTNLQNALPEGTNLGLTPGFEDESIDFDTLWYTGIQDGEMSHEGFLPLYSATNY